MEEWLQVPMIVGMFLLRLGIPLAITLAVGYWLRKLDAKWEAEAVARREQAGQSTFRRTPYARAEIDINKIIRERCWDINKCPQMVKVECPAWKQPNLACWEARTNTEGHLPEKCHNCELYEKGVPSSISLPH